MGVLHVAPKIDVVGDRLHGCTPWLPRLLWLFSYGRCVTVDRRLRHVAISTQQLWWWQRIRIVSFDQVSHIIYRAQALPSPSFWRYLSLTGSDTSTSAFFLILLALKSDSSELPLFMVWEEQPRESDWLDRLAGIRENPYRIGDESSRAIVEMLREFIGVPISSH